MVADSAFEDILTMNSEEVSRELTAVKKDLRHIQKTLKILEAKNQKSYQLALKNLAPDTRKLWEEELAGEDYNPTPESLREFLFEEILDYNKHMALLANHSAIMAQAQGESLDPERLDTLSRYEVFLDRKLERTLAMFLKL